MSATPEADGARIFRVPRSAYLVVLFVLIGTIPLAFAGALHDAVGSADSPVTDVVVGWRLVFLLVPLAAIAFIARTRTVVDPSGVTVRALLGTRHLSWTDIRGISVRRRSVFAVCGDGTVRLPCVTIGGLAAFTAASGGHLPQLAPPTPKYPLARRPRPRVRPR